jgi:hypothetical protein
MGNDDARRRWVGGEAALLLLLGIVVLLGQALDPDLGRVGWVFPTTMQTTDELRGNAGPGLESAFDRLAEHLA